MALTDFEHILLVVDSGSDAVSFRSALIHARIVCTPVLTAGSRSPATTECKRQQGNVEDRNNSLRAEKNKYNECFYYGDFKMFY